MLQRRLMLGVLTLAVLACTSPLRCVRAEDEPSAEALEIVKDYPLLKAALSDENFFKSLDTDDTFHAKLRTDLCNAAYRKVGDTRSVRVSMWRGTSTDYPIIVLEYQTSYARFALMPSQGASQRDPVLVGTGRDAIWDRTFYGGTDNPVAQQEFEDLMKKRAGMASNKRTQTNPEFTALAEKYLPTTPLKDVHDQVKGIVEKLLAASKNQGAHVLDDPMFGPYGVKINDHLYLYFREFPNGASRGSTDPFFSLIISGGPKQWANDYVPSFPGAEGMGARTTGGRGGKVVYVTTLNPTGPGSLGEAFATKGPRTILFKVSGQIFLPGGGEDTMKPGENGQIWISEPNCTLDGSTAPGDGIEIKGRLCISADNLIIRNMRFRLRPPFIKDGMSTYGNLKNVMFDHCSFAFDSDEQLRMIGFGSELLGFTFQYCILGPGLGGTGDHPYGPEIGGFGTFHHNIFYNTLSRSPEVDCDLIDWRYNIMANLRRGHSDRPRSRFNMIGNYIIEIPGNYQGNYAFDRTDAVYSDGNMHEIGDHVEPYRLAASAFLKHPYATVPVTADKPEELEAKLMPIAGATLPSRDSIDTYFLAQLKARKSKLPIYLKAGVNWSPYGNENANPQLYERWEDKDFDAKFSPPAAGAKAAADTDGDGMPDAWETANGFNPNDPSDGAADADKDGYTNLEEFLNHTNPHEFVDYKNPANNKPTLNIPVASPAK